MLRIVVCHPRQTHVHCLDAVEDVPYEVMHKLIDFSIIGFVMGKALPRVARLDTMGDDVQQQSNFNNAKIGMRGRKGQEPQAP